MKQLTVLFAVLTVISSSVLAGEINNPSDAEHCGAESEIATDVTSEQVKVAPDGAPAVEAE